MDRLLHFYANTTALSIKTCVATVSVSLLTTQEHLPTLEPTGKTLQTYW
jgi:hypothetical protein